MPTEPEWEKVSSYNHQMPGGARRTHDFPHGKPIPLRLVNIAFPILSIASAVYFGFDTWLNAAPTISIIAFFIVTKVYLLRAYERSGQAVRREHIRVVVRFPEGFPRPLLAARVSFFVVVTVMLVFGMGPFQFDAARRGIIGCVLGLFAVAAINLLLEAHYVKSGRATEVQFTSHRNLRH